MYWRAVGGLLFVGGAPPEAPASDLKAGGQRVSALRASWQVLRLEKPGAARFRFKAPEYVSGMVRAAWRTAQHASRSAAAGEAVRSQLSGGWWPSYR